MFSLDLSDGICHRIDCHVCLTHNGKGNSKCRKNNIVYKSSCNWWVAKGSNQGTYIGESGRSLYELSQELLADAMARKTSSHIWKHWALCHGSSMTKPKFSFNLIRVHRSCLERQVHEGIRISTEGALNSKAEWRQNQLKQISVHLT